MSPVDCLKHLHDARGLFLGIARNPYCKIPHYYDIVNIVLRTSGGARTVEEAIGLTAGLMTHAIQKKCEYRHQWHYGDFVIWDNRSVI